MASQVEEWQQRAEKFAVKDRKALDGVFAELDAHLTLRTYIIGYSQTDADLAVYKAIRGNHVANSFLKQGLLVNVSRWAKFIEETNPALSTSLPQRPAKGSQVNGEKKKDEGANLDLALEDTTDGVVTRFPPEPSGYLHIGHAKVSSVPSLRHPVLTRRAGGFFKRLFCPRAL